MNLLTTSSGQIFSYQDRFKRWLRLAIALAPLVGACVYNLGFRLPFSGCPLLHSIGIPCPAWGLTRSFMAIARGDLHQAMSYHLFGPFLFATFLLAAIHNLLELIKGRKIRTFYIALAKSPKFQILVFVMVFGYHSLRLYDLAQTGKLHLSLDHISNWIL